MPRERIEEPGVKEKVGRLFGYLGNIDNTIQWSWFLELSKELFGFEGDSIDAGNWELVYELASVENGSTRLGSPSAPDEPC